jgi:hypothetical protein
VPRAVLSAYPGRSLRGIPAGIPPVRPVPDGIPVLALGSTQDAVVGTSFARDIARSGARRPLHRGPHEGSAGPPRAPTSRRRRTSGLLGPARPPHRSRAAVSARQPGRSRARGGCCPPCGKDPPHAEPGRRSRRYDRISASTYAGTGTSA